MINLRQEIEILKILKHENIIRMLDSFETTTEFCVVTEVIFIKRLHKVNFLRFLKMIKI